MNSRVLGESQIKGATGGSQMGPQFTHLWKMNDGKAQKNGAHRSVYWVKKKQRQEDGSIKGEKWQQASRYIGDWKDNWKDGFGIQFYQNADKYEGMWCRDKRHGQGTYWRNESGKLRREYTGDWFEDKKHGRGTFFYKNGDRYDGYWVNGQPQGEGRMIYQNENIYEGQWHEGKRNGYGVLTKRNGDHFEGHWVNDMREGQGSYFYHDKNKLFVGEWVNDQPKTGVYTEVEDDETEKVNKKPYFTDPYVLPPIYELKLSDPTKILERAMERTKRERSKFRAQYIPIEEMFTGPELMDLKQAFEAAAQGEAYVNILSLKTLFSSMGIFPSDEMLNELLKSCGKEGEEDAISFDLFARSVALLLEENAERGSTSSHNEQQEYQQQMEMEGEEGEGDEEGDMGEDPYYNEYDVISKKFAKFYLTQFKPITILEDFDQKKSLNFYRGLTFTGAVGFGFVSYRFRRMKFGMMEAHEAPRQIDTYMYILNDAMAAFLGYTFTNILSCDYIYKHRQYVIERLYVEKNNDFNRNVFRLENDKLLDEYIFADQVSVSDKYIKDDRIHPVEIEEQNKEIREKIEKLNQEYLEQQMKKEATEKGEGGEPVPKTIV